MKKYYLRLRMMLMTFALGMASVGTFSDFFNESVMLFTDKSESTILYFKIKKLPFDRFGAGSGADYNCQRVKCESPTVIMTQE